MTAIKNTLTYGLPQDGWNEILSNCDLPTIKNSVFISKIFTEIVEQASVYILERFHLDKAENGKLSFRRIMNLGSLIHKWTILDLPPPDGSIRYPNFEQELKLFKNYLSIGINQYNYLTFDTSANYSRCLNANHLSSIVVKEFKENPIPSSLPGLLAFAKNHMRKDDDTGLAIRTIAYMTPELFRDHPAQKDLIDLFVRNLNDLPLALTYNSNRADKLLNQDFFNLANEHIQTLILFYLCNHDIKRLQNLISLIKDTWKLNSDLEKTKPGLQRIITSSYDDEMSLFLELLLLYKNEIEQITQKTIVSHVTTSGNALLLNKLKEAHNINFALDPCFHYAKNVEVAQILFESGADINYSFAEQGPLATALAFDNSEVADFLIDKNAGFYGLNMHNPLSFTTNLSTFQLLVKKARAFSLFGFLQTRNLRDIGQSKMLTWIALKELACRVARAAILPFAAVALIGIMDITYFGLGTYYVIPVVVYLTSLSTLTCLVFKEFKERQYKY